MLFCIYGHSQVVKCKDANGKIIYSDAACPTNATSSAVNLSGGNITEDQVRSAQERTANSSNTSGGEGCSMLKNLAQQTFGAFQENTNIKRWDVSFQALQNVANSCASPEVCGLIKTRIDLAQQRYNQDNTSYRGAQLNSVTALFASSCQRNGASKQSGNTQASSGEFQTPASNTKRTSGYQTRDTFGTIVNSQSCHWTKDAFGNDVRSSGCSK